MKKTKPATVAALESRTEELERRIATAESQHCFHPQVFVGPCSLPHYPCGRPHVAPFTPWTTPVITTGITGVQPNVVTVQGLGSNITWTTQH